MHRAPPPNRSSLLAMRGAGAWAALGRSLRMLVGRLAAALSDGAASTRAAAGAAGDGSSALRIPDGGTALRARPVPAAHRSAGAAPGPRTMDPVLLDVDDAGQFLLVFADRLVVGHARSGRADLPFLADVGARHARLERRTSLAGGVRWWVTPLAGERVAVAGRPCHGAHPLGAGDRVRLGGNLELEVEAADPASTSLLLRLLGGRECAGAPHVVLMAPGASGRLRIGADAGCVLRVPRSESALVLERAPATLVLRAAEGEERAVRERRVPLPLSDRVELVLGSPRGGRPPFSLSFAPSGLRAGAAGSGA